MEGQARIQFDGWTLERKSGELRKGTRAIRLQGQSLRVLEELLAHPGEVVLREELIARLWPKGVLDFDTALNSAVRRLRRALDDDADTPKYIETLPRKGYRFIGQLGPSLATETAAGHRRPRGAVGSVAACVLACILALMVMSRDAALVGGPGSNAAERAAAQPAELVARARYFLERRGTGDLRRARDYFEQVLVLDPACASCYAGLSSAYWLATREGEMTPAEGLPRLREFAQRALALDPRQAEAHQRLALYNFRIGAAAAAERHLQLAIEANPNDPLLLAMQASDELDRGHIDESVQLLRRAVAVAPLGSVYRYNLAANLYLAGRFEEALQVMQELLEINPGYRADLIAYIYILKGRFQEAIALAQTWPHGDDRLQVLALAYFGLGRTADADRALGELSRSVQDSEPLRVVEVFGYRKDTPRAIEWLQRTRRHAYGEGVRDPGPAPATIRYSPFVASIRDSLEWNRSVEALMSH